MNVPKSNVSPGRPGLIRAIGLPTATMLVAGVVIGSGVFKKIVPLAQTGLSEGWILAAWGLAGFITLCGALNLAGLASLTEESGGVYEYLRLSFGNIAAFLFGWTDFAIIGTGSVAALGFIFAQTVNTFWPLPNPLQSLAGIGIGHWMYPFADSGIKLLALGTIGGLTWVNYCGVAAGGTLSNVFTVAKVLGMVLLIVLGLWLAGPSASGLASLSAPVWHRPSFVSAFFVALLSVFWAYDGWLDLSFVTGEIQHPTRNVPRAIFAGVALAVGLYLLVNYAYLRAVPLPRLAAVGPNEIGAAVVAETVLGTWGKNGVTLLIMISVLGSLNAVLLSHSRIYFRMAQAGVFFPRAAAVHPRHRTPHVALFYTLAWSSLLVVSGTFDVLSDLVIFANFLFYGLLAVAVLKMKRLGRITGPVTGYPVVQGIIVLFSLGLIGNTLLSHPTQSLTGLALMLAGLPLYHYFTRRAARRRVAAQQ